MSAAIDLTDRSAFQHWYREKLRFSDTDLIGHVNNVAFAALIEGGRINFTRSGPFADLPRDVLVVMRRIELDYRAELHWPADIDIGSRLLRIGGSSVTIGNGVFHNDRCAATSVTVLVMIDRQTRKPVQIPEAMRRTMAGYIAPGPE